MLHCTCSCTLRGERLTLHTGVYCRQQCCMQLCVPGRCPGLRCREVPCPWSVPSPRGVSHETPRHTPGRPHSAGQSEKHGIRFLAKEWIATRINFALQCVLLQDHNLVILCTRSWPSAAHPNTTSTRSCRSSWLRRAAFRRCTSSHPLSGSLLPPLHRCSRT